MLAEPDRSATRTYALVRHALTMVFALQWEILTGVVYAVRVGRVELVTAPVVTPSAVKQARIRIHVLGGNFHLQPCNFV